MKRKGRRKEMLKGGTSSWWGAGADTFLTKEFRPFLAWK